MKPRCDRCEKAMKRPHERVGAQGSWQSIKDWWYCSSCKVMVHHPMFTISKDIQDYINKAVGAKYPIISKIREELNAEFVDINELEDAVQDDKHLESIAKSPKELLEKEKGRKTRMSNPAWVCKKCKHVQFFGENEKWIWSDHHEELPKGEIPDHCDEPMQIGFIPYSYGVYFRERLDEIAKQIEDKTYDPKSYQVLDYFLSLFGELYLTKMTVDYAYLLDRFPDLKNSQEIAIVKYMLSIFSYKNAKVYDWIDQTAFHVMTDFYTPGINFDKQSKESLEIIAKRFDDLKNLIIDKLDIETLTVKTVILANLWTIEQIIPLLSGPGKVMDLSGTAGIIPPQGNNE